MKSDKHASLDAKKRQVHFYAMYMPEDPKKYTMELKLGENGSQFEKIEDPVVSMEMLNPDAVVYKKGNLRLMKGSMPIFETVDRSKVKRYVKKKRRIMSSLTPTSFKIVTIVSQGMYRYYDEDKGREISTL